MSVKLNSVASLSIGIVGLPNVGKSTLFNALTNNNVLAANYPFATIEPNIGIVPVPDERLKQLSQLYGNAPIKPATVTFVDIAGLVAGASKGEGLGNQFLSHIRNCNAIVHVVRDFVDPNLKDDVGPAPRQSIATINTELILADLQTVENRLPKLAKEVKADKNLAPQLELLEKLQTGLNNGQLASDVLSGEGSLELADLHLLTLKPVIYLFNVDEALLTEKQQLEKLSKSVSYKSIIVSAKLEDELKSLDMADRQELLLSYDQTISGLEQLISAGYKVLGLQSFLTAGEKEVRAWTIKTGMTAPQAAGVIHGDFERGFIAAEVVNFNDLIAAGSLTNARAKGQVRTEGKNYVMQENDVVEFRFNVSNKG